jgi:hypothetical protein
MFLSPPLLRRRKPSVAAAASHFYPSTPAAADYSAATSDIDMGNEHSFSNLPDNTKAAAFNFVATHPNGAGLMSMLTSSTPHTQQQQVDSGKKFQCRWCIETFPRKFNKDRHEARKHARKLAEAASANLEAASELQPVSTSEDHSTGIEFPSVRETGRKRNLSEAQARKEECESNSVSAIETPSLATFLVTTSNSEFPFPHPQVRIDLVNWILFLQASIRSAPRFSFNPSISESTLVQCPVAKGTLPGLFHFSSWRDC